MLNTFIKKLKEESALWVADGLIGSQERERILERYRLQEELDHKAGSTRLVSTLSVMGAVMVGVGVVLFIASNWAEIARPAKVTIILGSMLFSYAIGWWIRHEMRDGYPKVGAALILLGSIIYGAGIFLIAQIYNVSVHYPNGMLYWWLGILPLAYLLRLAPMIALSTLTMLVWLGSEASFRIMHETLFSYSALYLICGILLWELGLHHKQSMSEGFKKFGTSYQVFGLLIVFGVLFIATFDDFFAVYSIRTNVARAPDTIAPFYLVIGLMVLASMGARLYRAHKSGNLRRDAIDAPVIMLLLVLAVYFGLFFKGVPSHMAGAYALASNVLYAFFIVGMIIIGYFRKMLAYINIGLAFFAIDITARYFDYFWKLLPRSIFFVIGGLLLLGGGLLLERQRRKVLSKMQDRQVSV